MRIVSQTILGYNITLVYKTLDLKIIDSREIKKLLGDNVLGTDAPDMLFFIHPIGPTIIQIGDRRIRITYSGESDEFKALWDIARGSHDQVTDSNLLAYGFNYDLGVEITDGDVNKRVIEQYIPDLSGIESILDGHLLSVSPVIKYQRGQTRYDLVLEPVDASRIKIHMNAHFGNDGITLPNQEQLEISFIEEFNYLKSVLSRHFG